MTEAIRSRDFWSGAIFVVVGATMAWIARSYDIGTAKDMGPGYFPAALALLLVALGLKLVIVALLTKGGHDGRISAISLRPLLAISAAVLVFALLIRTAGFPLTVALTSLVASLASRDMTPISAICIAMFLAIACTLVFQIGLKLPVPLWPRLMLG